MPSASGVSGRAVSVPLLRVGDRVRLVSPASYPSTEWLAESARILGEWGLRVEVGDHALDEWGYLAGRDADRLDDLNAALRDPGVRAVITTRGGAGAYRIVDGIDFDAVRADPKPVLGFSDTTNIHLALWRHCRVPAIHGCLSGDRAVATARQLLMTGQPVTLHRDPIAASVAVAAEIPGRASGWLMGGNLSALVGYVGAGMPDLDGAIVCLEDNRCAGDPVRLDRYLHQLLAAGALDGVRAVALGGLGDLGGDPDPGAEGWPELVAVLRERLGALGVPVLAGLPFGHIANQSCFPLGATGTVDTAAGTLTADAVVARC